MAEYVKIRSWHRVKLTTRASWSKTFCGRLVKDANAQILHELPDEKSCESCLRNAAIWEENANRVS